MSTLQVCTLLILHLLFSRSYGASLDQIPAEKCLLKILCPESIPLLNPVQEPEIVEVSMYYSCRLEFTIFGLQNICYPIIYNPYNNIEFQPKILRFVKLQTPQLTVSSINVNKKQFTTNNKKLDVPISVDTTNEQLPTMHKQFFKPEEESLPQPESYPEMAAKSHEPEEFMKSNEKNKEIYDNFNKEILKDRFAPTEGYSHNSHDLSKSVQDNQENGDIFNKEIQKDRFIPTESYFEMAAKTHKPKELNYMPDISKEVNEETDRNVEPDDQDRNNNSEDVVLDGMLHISRNCLGDFGHDDNCQEVFEYGK